MNMDHHAISRVGPLPSRTRGLSLIEVLVALLVLAIGLLAMAGLHATSLKLNQVNQYRLTATEVGQFLGEAVKANNEAALNNQGYIRTAVDAANPQPGFMCNLPADNCSPAQIAALDMFAARRNARNLLPDGDIFSQLNPAGVATGNTTPTLTIWVYWVNPSVTRNSDAAKAAQLDALLESPCPPAVAALNPRRSCVEYVVSL